MIQVQEQRERCSAGQWERWSAGKRQSSSDCLSEVALRPWKSPSRKEGMKKQCTKTFSHRPRIWKNERTYTVWSKQAKGKFEKVWKEVTWRGRAWASGIMKGDLQRKIPRNVQHRQRQFGKDVHKDSSAKYCISFAGKSVFLVKQHPGSSQHNPVPSSLLLSWPHTFYLLQRVRNALNLVTFFT